MRKLTLSIISLLLITTSFANAQSRKSTHIQNPSFGSSSRYQIVEDPVIESEKEEKPEITTEKKSKKHLKSSERNFDSEAVQLSKSQNIQDFLEEKGFLVMTTGGTGSKSELSYKGYTSFCIKVYVNGVLANNPTTGEFDWNSIDVNSIESIEIDEVPALDEAQFAGCVIRITTKFQEEKAFIEVAGSGYENSAFDTWHARTYVAQSFNKFSYNFGAEVVQAKNEFERHKLLGTNKDNFANQDIFNFGWNADLNENLRLYGNDVFAYNQVKAYGTGSNYDTGIEDDISFRNNINASYSKENFKSESSICYNLGNVKYVNSYKANNIDNTGFNKIGITERINWIVDLTFGIDYEWLVSTSGSSRLAFNAGIGKKFSFGDFSVEPQVAGLFWYSGNGGAKVLPRLNFFWQGITLSLFRSCVLPTFNQLYWPDTSYAKGNLQLKPEEGWNLFFGFKRSDFPLWAQYSLSYYGNKVRWGSENGKLMPVNNGDAVYNVVTLGADFDFFDRHLSISGDGTYISARLCSTGKQIMWVPLWQTHAGVTVRMWKFTCVMDYAFTGYRYMSNDNVFYYPASHLLNASISVKPEEHIELYVKGTNLLDQRVPYHDNYYMPSRKITVGVKLEK